MVTASAYRRSADHSQLATALIFAVHGAVFATWASRIPAVKDELDIGIGILGLCLFGMGFGSFVAKPIAGRLVRRFGSGPVARCTVLASCLALPLPALAGGAASLGTTMVLLGMTMGLNDVAMNAQAVAVQKRAGRSVMSLFHGLYSAGGLFGVTVGSLITRFGVSFGWHFAGAALLLAAVSSVASRGVLPGSSDATPTVSQDKSSSDSPARYSRLTLALFATAAFCAMLAEGAAADWSAVYIRDDLDASQAVASLGYAAYTLAMLLTRLIGDKVITRFGGASTAAMASAVAGSVFGLALVAGYPDAAIVGYGVLGIGLATVGPVVFTLAAKVTAPSAGVGVTVISSASGLGFLGGPPMIGVLAEVIGLPRALGLVTLLVVLSAVLLSTAGRRMHVADRGPRTPTVVD